MAFTQPQLDNIANAALDHYIRKQPLSQSIQDKPLLAALNSRKKFFPGGKGDIVKNVKGDYTSEFSGYTHNDSVAYVNPANIKQVAFPWRELHLGISMTHTELKMDGVEVVNDNGSRTNTVTGAEQTRISSLLEDKLEDMFEGGRRSLNDYFWRDGTQDAKGPAGVKAYIVDDPTTGTVGGLDRATNTWFRNRAAVDKTGVGGADDSITHSVANQTLTKTLRQEVRQLRRYGGRPNLALCGSDFIEMLEAEVHEKGNYTLTGFTDNGKNEIGMANISLQGVGTFQYDPSLDDLGEADRCYIFDTRHIFPMVMTGQELKRWSPQRPADQYVLYRAVTWTGQVIVDQLNCHGVYQAK